MKTKTIFAIASIIFAINAMGQKLSINLTFTAIKNLAYYRLDSIRVMNRTHGSDTTIYWPDTTLNYEFNPGDLLLYIGYSTGYPAGIHEIEQKKEKFQLFQNYPNPVADKSTISLYIPQKGTVTFMITDLSGKKVVNVEMLLGKGHQSFNFTPGSGNLYILTARWNGISRSIKIISTGSNSGKCCLLEYKGTNAGESQWKASLVEAGMIRQESGILDYPTANGTHTFQFATNIPCPGTTTVTYEGHVYHTTQIFSQCWMKENLNVGTMISGTLDMTDNGIIEKYCYNDIQDSCTKYGGLYQWGEAMKYNIQEGAQGICPPGWHIPTDEEWKVMEGATDSKYGIGDPEWNKTLIHGFDAGKHLKATSGWNAGGNGTDVFGFSAYPDGGRFSQGFFTRVGYGNYWWTSSQYDEYDACHRFLKCYYPAVYRDFDLKIYGFSVRCLRE